MGVADSGTPAVPAGCDMPGYYSKCKCTLTSETIARIPVNRGRTVIGVGEYVKVTVSGGNATWTVTGGGAIVGTQSGTDVTFRAGDQPVPITVTASIDSCSCSLTFTVIAPAGFHMAIESQVGHTIHRPTCAFLAAMYLMPLGVVRIDLCSRAR